MSATLIVAAGASTAAVPVPHNAVWAEHDLRLELQHLPRIYSCEDLSNKIHDVLQTVGARADMRISVNRCASGIDTRLVAPRAHVVFSLPLVVRGHLAWSAEFYARERTVRIEPGNPPSVDYSDCELLRQLELNLLLPASLSIEPANLTCQRLATQHAHFSLSIDALMPDAAGPANVVREWLKPLRPGAHG
jgi:hypothetical protein